MTETTLRFRNQAGELFPEWKPVQLRDICQYSNEHGSGSNYIGTENMYQNFAGADVDESRTGKGIIYHAGDTLMSNIRPYLKKTWFADRNGVCSTDVLVFQPNGVSPEFLYQMISSDKFVQYVMGGVKGSKMPRGDKNHILDYGFMEPSLEEQERIVPLLSAVDARISEQESLIEDLEERKKGLMQKLFSQELRFKADDGTEYEEWKNVCLGDVCTGFDYGMNAAAGSYDGKHKYIRITDIDESSHRYSTVDIASPTGVIDEKYLVTDGTILLARTGASTGKAYLYRREDGALYFAGFLIRAIVKPEYVPYFVFAQTLTHEYKKWVALTSMRTGQPGINAQEYQKYSFMCPSDKNEQQKIADVLSAIDEQIENERLILEDWKNLKRGLLQKMFV